MALTLGRNTTTSTMAAMKSRVALIGRVTKVVGSPRDRIIARRRFSSSNGPRTKPSRSGAGSQRSFNKR
ncbi:hypothetical protein D3C71_2173510 [compost metagenome]